jgi:hypothetical protein
LKNLTGRIFSESFMQRSTILFEMTGIPALQRLYPSLPMLPAHVERREFEYKRIHAA